jgi:hypothetical protein
MERIKKHSEAVIRLLQEMACPLREGEKIYEQVIFDRENHHYMLLWLGFNQIGSFVDRVIVHFQIKPDGKIWILANATEEDVAETLTKMKVKPSDIVLGFHPEQVRAHSGYAVA